MLQGLVAIFSVIVVVMAPLQVYAAPAGKTASGKTQVVAKVGAREITLSDLRVELVKYGASMNDAAAVRDALDAIINRHLITDAARRARVDREAEAIRAVAAAKEQALANYFLATRTQPPEPTRDEIDSYITNNKDLFQDRAYYSFNVLTLPTSFFEARELAPLFDETSDFLVLQKFLDSKEIKFAVSTLSRPAGAFPPPIRKQLAAYGVNDNIVIKSDEETQILKITNIVSAPLTGREARILARNLLMQDMSQQRAAALVDRLKEDAAVHYYNAAFAPIAEQ